VKDKPRHNFLDARLSGRNLEPWRAILAVAAWLDSHDTAGALPRPLDEELWTHRQAKDTAIEPAHPLGLFARLETLSVAYQEERSDLEAYDPTRLLIKGLQAMSAKRLDDPIEFSTAELTAEMNALAVKEEIADAEEKFTNARRVGHLLDRLRFKKAQRTAKGKRW
jgi:hypothetical protein